MLVTGADLEPTTVGERSDLGRVRGFEQEAVEADQVFAMGIGLTQSIDFVGEGDTGEALFFVH